MRTFNPEKELKKIQKGNKNKIIFGVIALLIVIAIGSSYALYQIKYNKQIIYTTVEPFYSKDLQIAVYVNGEKKDAFPSKDGEYFYATYECEKNSKITFDEEEWSATLTTNHQDKCNIYFVDSNQIHNFGFTGNEQDFIASNTGKYKIELWGASGGTTETGAKGGQGAYTTGIIKLNEGETLYVYVGEGGKTTTRLTVAVLDATFNGGGNGKQHTYTNGASGGGATDIRLTKGTNWDDLEGLKSRIMVAAGGGGGFYWTNKGNGSGGFGGGLVGGEGIQLFESISGEDTRIQANAMGGFQTSGGATNDKKSIEYYGKFGIGGNANGNNSTSGSGGGGGYYGGAGGRDQGFSGSAGGGGSSYISGYKGCVAIMESSVEDNIQIKDNCTEETAKSDITCSYHYSNRIFTNTLMIAGNEEMLSPSGETEVGHSGDGYARITYLAPKN